MATETPHNDVTRNESGFRLVDASIGCGSGIDTGPNTSMHHNKTTRSSAPLDKEQGDHGKGMLSQEEECDETSRLVEDNRPSGLESPLEVIAGDKVLESPEPVSGRSSRNHSRNGSWSELWELGLGTSHAPIKNRDRSDPEYNPLFSKTGEYLRSKLPKSKKSSSKKATTRDPSVGSLFDDDSADEWMDGGARRDSVIGDEPVDDDFSKHMRIHGLAHVTSSGEDVKLNHGMLPPEFDLNAFSETLDVNN